jgi:hypothetical protein
MGMDVSHGLMSAMTGYIHLIIIIGKIGAKEEHITSASDKFAYHLNLNLELKDSKQQQRGSHGSHGTWETSIPVMTDCLRIDASHGLMTEMNNRAGKKHVHRQNRTDDQQLGRK